MRRLEPLAPLPDMTVVEISIIVALLRRGAATAEALVPVLADWFAEPVGRSELFASVDRLHGRGLLNRRTDGTLVPAPAAFRPTQRLYAAFIRMLGRDAAPDGSAGAGEAPVRALREAARGLKLIETNEKVAHDHA